MSELVLWRDEVAARAMQARMQAGWTNPDPSSRAYHEWKKGLPPDSERNSFYDWIADCAYEMADAMLAARTQNPEAA